jgi:tetratricopeptide (TPR) repeat protein
LELAPGNLDVRIQAAELALVTLQFPVVLSLLPTPEAMNGEDAGMVARMTAMMAEAMLEGGDVDGALACIERGLAAMPEDPYLVAVKVRCLAKQGRLSTAQRLAQSLLAGLEDTKDSWEGDYLDYGWVGDAWLAVFEWERGLRALQQNAEIHADVPLAHWRYARGIIQTMESHHWLSRLACEVHTPSTEWVSRYASSGYEQAIRPLMNLSGSVPVQSLLARGRLIFETTHQNLRALVTLSINGENAVTILGALARLENWAGVERIARQYLMDPWVNFHAAVFLKDKMPDFARQLAQQATLALSEFAPAYMVLGVCAQAQESFEIAINAMEQAVSLWPEEWRWLEQVATLALRLEDDERAACYLDMLLKYQPENLAAHLNAARIQANLGNSDLALGHLERALQLAPNDPEVVLLYISTLLRFERAAEASVMAEIYLERLPGNKEIAILAARAALESKNWDRADELTSCLLEDEPTDERITRLRVSYLEAQGRLSEALTLIERFLAENHNRGEETSLAFEKAHLIYRLRGAAEAIPPLEAILAKNPEDTASLGLAARAYYAVQNFEKAEIMALKALQCNREQADLHALLGEMYARAGQLDKALYHYGEVLRLNPQEIDVYLAMARLYQQRRELPKAYAVYQQALRVAPRDYRLYFEYGLALRDGKDYPAAEAMLRKAAQLAPENLQVRRQLGALVALNLVHQS